MNESFSVRSEPVVIVGFGGVFPGGPDVAAFWQNVAQGRDAGRSVPANRWTLSPDKARTPGRHQPDKTYSTWGCYLDDHIAALQPDHETSNLDPVCRLALHTAAEALNSIRLEDSDRSRAGVILGHIVLPTESTSAIARDVILADFERRFLPGEFHQKLSWGRRNRRVAALPAELIADRFQFGGTAFTLDAACASSLYALKLAVDELQSGQADLMLAGGLSRPDCQYTQIGFTQLQALSKRGRCAPLSAQADGLVVGEGAGFFVLKRLSDAIAAGDTIHAVIAGIGLSNDRGANLLAPHSEGQLRAMQAAYEQAGWSPGDVDYIECHATGTPTGDAVELASLHQLWAGESSRPGQCVLGAVKSNVGHLLTGAGGAGVMKLLGMLKSRELWPIANLSEPAELLRDPRSPFRVLHQAEVWKEQVDRPRRAAINAFGFGGINAHVLIEEYQPARHAAHQVPVRPSENDEIVLIGVEARVGNCLDLAAIRNQLCQPSESFIGKIPQIEIPLGEFRIPPVELPDLLPQQQLMLHMVSRALEQAGTGRSLGNRTGVFIGVSLDPNTTNFHCRWAIAERAAGYAAKLGLDLSDEELARWTTELQDTFGPPLTPNRVMGHLAAVTASRIAREFDIGGPSFTISADEDSGLRSIELAIRALERGEIDLAITGAVEFECDRRTETAGDVERGADGAVTFLLKRRRDAERDGNPILAKIDASVGLQLCRPSLFPPNSLGYGLATAGTVRLLTHYLALRDGLDFGTGTRKLMLRNRRDGLRQLAVQTTRGDAEVVLTEVLSAERPVDAVGLSRHLFVVRGNSESGLLGQLLDLKLLCAGDGSIPALAARWWAQSTRAANSPAMVLIAGSKDELLSAIEVARSAVQARTAIRSEQVIYEPSPLGQAGKLAFVFPGSGNAFPGMGRELLTAFLGVLARQHAENEELRNQYRPDIIWEDPSGETLRRDHKAMIFGQVSLGTAICDLLAAFGVRPRASLGYSLGESAALFGLRIWRRRDEMLDRMRNSALFGSDLVAPFNAARRAWNIPPDQAVPWVSGVISAPVEDVREAVSRRIKCDLLIVNTPRQCVIGGDARQMEAIVNELAAPFTPLSSPSTVHCSILNEVRRDYLELHRMETHPPDGVDVYSSATGEPYGLSRDAAAGAILAQATDTVDFSRVVQNAYRNGVRLFLEIGPGNSCTRMIDDILAEEPHWAGAACPATSDPVGQWLQVLAQLIAHGEPVDLSPLFSQSELARLTDSREKIVTPVGWKRLGPVPVPDQRGVERVMPLEASVGGGVWESGSERVNAGSRKQIVTALTEWPPHPNPLPGSGGEGTRGGNRENNDFHPQTPALKDSRTSSEFTALAAMLAQRAEAHATFLQFAERSQSLVARLTSGQSHFDESDQSQMDVAVTERPPHPNPLPRSGGEGTGNVGAASDLHIDASLHPQTLTPPHSHTSSEPPRSLDYNQCLAFAIGNIGDVLGPKFAPIDEFPTRVRLPDEPLMLCHRILDIEGEPLSMSHGRLITEHDIVPDAWYLDCGRIPTCIAVEAGQADLFLSGWLGIDFETRGEAVYRLLDAVVTFHDALPGSGATIRYDIRINHFFRQGSTWLFRFEFDATVDGRKLLTMRDGCAGFFSAAELNAGKGIVQTTLDRQPRPGIRSADWTAPVPMMVESFSDAQLTALRRGDLATCFGPAFQDLPIRHPVTIPDGRMRLVDRVLQLDPAGGKYGLGSIRAEADIHPNDWFLTCHFCDDQVMPGTLMYECCLHTLRIYLLRMGWIGETGEIAYEPIPEIRSRLKCRGQVLASTKTVWYEVTLKEIGYGIPGVTTPEASAYCIADALMYADGKPIVEITDMSVRLTGLTRERVEELWRAKSPAKRKRVLFDTDRITEFAIGKPSRAFGDRYRVFDEDRKIARLPGPPFQFLDRIVSIEHCEPWKLAAGGVIIAEYDVPPDAWYFAANRQPHMPFAVLLETALQPCGWLAGYLGSALTSDTDLSFRNLGGKATQFEQITPQSGTLATTVKITAVSQSAGMIIQHFEFDLRCDGRPVYQGKTYFGFFSHAALANQVGIRDAAVYQATPEEQNRAKTFVVSHDAPFPSDEFRMIDRVTTFVPDGGPQKLGYIQGQIDVDPGFWFFKAHFYQDPVWPGSLGLESFLQLMRVYVEKRWGRREGEPSASGMALNAPHEWVYRGQVIPRDKTVTVDVVITTVDDVNQRVTASGFLTVDGRVIYQMIDFTMAVG